MNNEVDQAQRTGLGKLESRSAHWETTKSFSEPCYRPREEVTTIGTEVLLGKATVLPNTLFCSALYARHWSPLLSTLQTWTHLSLTTTPWKFVLLLSPYDRWVNWSSIYKLHWVTCPKSHSWWVPGFELRQSRSNGCIILPLSRNIWFLCFLCLTSFFNNSWASLLCWRISLTLLALPWTTNFCGVLSHLLHCLLWHYSWTTCSCHPPNNFFINSPISSWKWGCKVLLLFCEWWNQGKQIA